MSRKRGRPKKAEVKSLIADFETVDFDDTTCEKCYAEFLEPTDLQLHFDQVHGIIKGIISCEFCAQTFSDSERLAIHIRNEHVKHLFVCKICFQCFTKINECAAHEKLHRSAIKNMHSCSNCKQVFSLVKELELHEVEAHYSSNGVHLHKHYSLLSSVLNIQIETFLKALGTDTVYVCQKCTYSNSDLDRYLNHLKKSNCRSVACDKCYFVFHGKHFLTRHLLKSEACTNGGNSSNRFRDCPKCNQAVLHYVYAEHKIKCEAIKCQHCDVILPSGVEFVEHYSKNHPKSISVHQCRYCNKYFFEEKVMQKHVDRIHKPELHLYKYKCQDCDIAYKHPNQLFIHFLRHHPKIQPFHCKICDKSFKLRRKFTIHIKIEHNSKGIVKFTDDSHVVFEESTVSKPNISSNENDDKNNKSELTDEILADVNENANSEKDDNNEAEPNEGNTENSITEAEKTDVTLQESTTVPKRRRETETLVEFLESESDDEPLIKIAKKSRRKTRRRVKKEELTCKVCNKKCYTILNYRHHMAIHQNKSKFCIKCEASFRTIKDLNNHYAEAHSNSALTDTLKRLLEKRKRFEPPKTPKIDKPQEMTEKFRNTIKKVEFKKSNFIATLSEIKEGIDNTTEPLKKDIKINTSITLKKVNDTSLKPPSIKIYKVQPAKPISGPVKLAMPTKCKFTPPKDRPIATIKLVSNKLEKAPPKLNFGDQYILPDADSLTIYTDYQVHSEDSAIPEVAQEVMLNATDHVETTPINYTHKIVIPNVTDSSGYENIRIAHLLPQAPYYKIVSVKEILQSDDQSIPKPTQKQSNNFELPDGTKLVNVNPLAHLLKGKKILVDPPKKRKFERRKTKKEITKNYQQEVAKALMKLEIKGTLKKSTRKPKRRCIPDDPYENDDLIKQTEKVKSIKTQEMPYDLKPIEDAGQNASVADAQETTVDSQDPTVIEYLDEYEDIVETANTVAEENVEIQTGPGLSLPEL